MEAPMRTRGSLLVIIVSAVAVLLQRAPTTVRAQAQSSVALAGKVTSADERLMEGVLVSARRAGATITITVVSDAEGRYRFPSEKLSPGRYALRIRAVGYDLDGPRLWTSRPENS
jgi:virginiamycin B lyase